MTLVPNSVKFNLERPLQATGKNNIYTVGCQDNLMKMSVISTYLARASFLAIVLVLFIATFILAIGVAAGQDHDQLAHSKKVLVLDPGHGGHDVGAGRANDIYEKEVTLLFAGLLADKLKPVYTVHLTRSDDYEVDLMHRPAVANHLEADLFLSLHTGASTLHNPNGMMIAYYDGQFRMQDLETKPTQDPLKKGNQLTPWDKNALDHLEKSRRLAELLKEKILGYDPDIKVDIQGMPIVVLEGSTQPALLLEIGYLTNPADLQKLKDRNVLADYADIISAALDDYFSGLSD